MIVTPQIDALGEHFSVDAIPGSYNDWVRAIGERVKAGEPVPVFFLGKSDG